MRLEYNDKQHAYWLNGRRAKGVTSVAKYPEDTYKLEKWQVRMIVIGMARSPALVHRAAAHFDERDKIEEIAEEALALAKANEASARGTADHRITERVDLGLDWIDTPEHRAVSAAWTSALAAGGLEILPEYTERIVVYPDEMICGRYDRIARYRQTGRLVVVDVKTGESAINYPHSTCIQLGLYANAPLMAGPMHRIRKGDQWVEWTDQFEPLPDNLHRDHGVVVYLPPEGPGTCHRINIQAGWTAARDICFPTISWRKRDKGELVEPLGECLVAPLTTPERHQWIRNRIRAIVTAGHEQELAGIWDTTLVSIPLAADTPLSDQQIDTLVGWCSHIEALAGLPFEPTDPLYQPFVPVVVKDPPPVDNGHLARMQEAEQWATKARDLISPFDKPAREAIAKACGIDPQALMTEAMYTRVEAVVTELAHPQGAVWFAYDENGVTVESSDLAEHRMITIAGSSTEAKAAAVTVAKQAGHIAPRSLTKAAQIPLLAAMVAAGHGANNTTTNKEHTAS